MLKRVVGGVAALTMGGALVAAGVSPASAATVKKACPGSAVKRCIAIGNPSAGTYKAWAKITDNQNDSANYTVWVSNLKLQIATNQGWGTIRSAADNDGRYQAWEDANTKQWSCTANVRGFQVKLRSVATFHWVQAGSTKVTSAVIPSGYKWVGCKFVSAA